MADSQLGHFCVVAWRLLQIIRGYTLDEERSYTGMGMVIWMKCPQRNFLRGLMGGIVQTRFMSQLMLDVRWVAHMLHVLRERH